RSLSPDLGTERGESRSAATAVASSPDGAGAHADHEPTTSRGAERGPTLQEEVVAGRRGGGTGGGWGVHVGRAAAGRAAGGLPATGPVGQVERESAPAGTYHETRELSTAFPAGGSGASDGAQPPGMAQ